MSRVPVGDLDAWWCPTCIGQRQHSMQAAIEVAMHLIRSTVVWKMKGLGGHSHHGRGDLLLAGRIRVIAVTC